MQSDSCRPVPLLTDSGGEVGGAEEEGDKSPPSSSSTKSRGAPWKLVAHYYQNGKTLNGSLAIFGNLFSDLQKIEQNSGGIQSDVRVCGFQTSIQIPHDELLLGQRERGEVVRSVDVFPGTTSIKSIVLWLLWSKFCTSMSLIP